MVVKTNLELAACMLLFILLLASWNNEVIDNLFCAVDSLVEGCRAICIFLTGRFMDHGWSTTIRFHLTSPCCKLLG